MKTRRGMVVVGSALLAFGVITASAFFGSRIIEQWYCWRLKDESLEVVGKHLESELAPARLAAARILVAAGLSAYPIITKAIEDPYKPIWDKTVNSLVTIGPDAVPALLAVLRVDDSGDLRHTGAIPALLRIGSDALPGMEKAFGDPEWEVRATAAVALRFFALSGNH
jgi:HEAT repeat protein